MNQTKNIQNMTTQNNDMVNLTAQSVGMIFEENYLTKEEKVQYLIDSANDISESSLMVTVLQMKVKGLVSSLVWDSVYTPVEYV